MAMSSQAKGPHQPKKYKLWTWKVFEKSLYQNLTIESLSFLFCKKLSVLSLNNLELKKY